MREQTDMRQYSISQQYRFHELDKDTTMENISLGFSCSYSDLRRVYPEDLHWDSCQHRGFGGYGIFEVAVCVVNSSYWNKEGPFVYKTGHVAFFGGSVDKIQSQFEKWFLDNRDLKNEPFPHRYGRKITPVCLPIRGYELYVPKTKE